MPGLYTEILPGGGAIWGMDKRGGRRVEAQWYHVRCYTLGGQDDTRGGQE